jgi:hypothetical protein
VPIYDYQCPAGHCFEAIRKVEERAIPCADCDLVAVRIWVSPPVARRDTVPGGFTIENLDTVPRHFTSKSEYQAELKRRGLTNDRFHASNPRGPYSTKW